MAIAPINASAIGDTPVVTAVAGKKIRVQRVIVSALAANNVKLRSGTTDLTGLLYLGATSTVAVGSEQAGAGGAFLFETVAGQALNVNLSAATAVGGWVDYTLE